MTDTRRGSLHFDGGGWVKYTPPGQRYPARVHLTHKPDPDIWVVDEVCYALFRVTANDLRAIPLAHIELWVTRLVRQGIVADVDGDPKVTGDVQVGNDAAGVLTAVPLPAGSEATAPHAKPDSFYAQVAEVYRQAATMSTRPAAELAEAWDKPLTTIHRWIKEAKRRGHLPAGDARRRASA